MIKGRTETITVDLKGFIQEMIQHIDTVSVTFHHSEGQCNGAPIENIKHIKEITDKYNIKLICAGGINSLEDIRNLINLKVIPQFGSGLWKDYFTLGDVYQEVLNVNKQEEWIMNNKNEPLFPTIIQHTNGIVLGLCYSTPFTIKMSVDTKVLTIYSRDRNKIWIKGESSGNRFTVKNLHLACDQTALRMIVSSNVDFCHKKSISCFGDTDVSRGGMRSILDHIKSRLNDPTSYSSMISRRQDVVHTKILEEVDELLCATTDNDIASETADVIYFVLMNLINKGIPIEMVENEFIRRRYIVSEKKTDMQSLNKNNIRIGIVTSKIDASPVIKYLESILNVTITSQSDNPRDLRYVCSDSNINIIQTKPKDVQKFISLGYIDAVVSFDDIINNSSIKATMLQINSPQQTHVSIIVAVKKGIKIENLKEINKNRKLIMMAEYIKLATQWVKKVGLNVKIEHVFGSAESYVVNDLCDMAVVVCDTGKTLEANDMEILDIITVTTMHLFASEKGIEKFTTRVK